MGTLLFGGEVTVFVSLLSLLFCFTTLVCEQLKEAKEKEDLPNAEAEQCSLVSIFSF